MAFSNPAYLAEFVRSAARYDPAVRHFCLVAPLAVVLERLERRNGPRGDRDRSWQVRRARECCAAHAAAEYAEHIRAENRTPDEIASEIAARLG
jgi:chloramphenicol 3-O-phosphotransferase